MRRYSDILDPPEPPDPPEAVRLLDTLGRRMLKRRIDALKSLPTFPASIHRINEVLSGEATEASFEHIAAAIETDPVLVARVLRLVNQAFYGVTGAIVTMQDALVMLGLDIVKGLILSTHAMQMLGARRGLGGLWEHCYGAAVAAGALARVLDMRRVEALSAAALMHDIGKVVLASQMPEDYRQVVAHAREHGLRVGEAEQALLGVRHDEIGRWLVLRWRLPAALSEPIAWHHAPSKAGAHQEAAAIVHMADLMVRAYGFGFAGDAHMPDLDLAAWRLLGLNARTMREAMARMHSALHRTLQQAALYPIR